MNYLSHHGVKGMKWGVRRYQNPDGSLTTAGKKRRSKAINANFMDRKDLLRLLDSGKDFVVQKGTEAYRTTNHSNEKIDGKKYVSERRNET